MKTLTRLFLLTLLILLFCHNSIQAATQNQNESKDSVVKEQWDKKVQEIKTEKQVVIEQAPKKSNTAVHPSQRIHHLPRVFYKKITIKGNNIPLIVILNSISKMTGFNAIYGPEVDPQRQISLDCDNIEIWRALNTIFYPLDYGFKVNKHDLIILATETRSFRIVLPPVDQSFSDSTSNESFVASNSQGSSSDNKASSQEVRVGTKILVESSLEKLSFWDDVVGNLKNLISDKAKYSINKTAGLVIVTDYPSKLDQVQAYFNEINAKISQQIAVDVKVVEVTLTDESKMGIDWNALAKNLTGLDSLSFATNFAKNNFTSGDFFTFSATGDESGSGTTASGVNAVLKALETYGNVEVVSQPKITLLNNIPAVIQVGTTKAFVDSSQIQATQTGTTTSLSTSQVQSGVTMRLMGSVVDDDIYLSVTPSVTTIDSIRSVTSGSTTIEAPQTTTKSLNTMVKVKANETVAIGGLITSNTSDNQNKVPVISKIPIIGKLFSYTEKAKNRSELIIFITPKRS